MDFQQRLLRYFKRRFCHIKKFDLAIPFLLFSATLGHASATETGATTNSSSDSPASTYWLAPDPRVQSTACLNALAALRERVARQPTTAMMAVRENRIIFSYGPIAHASQVASVRKSLLAMLYGRAVKEKEIDLDATLADLHIDDLGGLSSTERQAKVHDLIEARSGVYHAAANTGDDARYAPPRGSHMPGSYFLYNNWDFNVAGDIYEQQTGEGIYSSFEREIATPLQLEDFDPKRHQRGGDMSLSTHKTYPFILSARDMARIGQLMMKHGRWDGKQLIDADWIDRIITPVTVSSEMHPSKTAAHELSYGDMWWIIEQGVKHRRAPSLYGGYFAWGYFGQWILVLPARNMVVVHKFDTNAIPGSANAPTTVSLETFLLEAAELADAPCG